MCLPTVKTSLMNLAEKVMETSWIAWWNPPWRWKYNQRMNSVKKSLQKNTHSHRHHAIISKLSCHHIPGIPLTFHQNIPLTLHYLHSSQLCFVAPTVVYANNLPCLGHLSAARSRGRLCGPQYCDTPQKMSPPPKKKMWGSYYWHPNIIYIYMYIICIYIYIYMYRYIIYLVVSTPIEKNMLVK